MKKAEHIKQQTVNDTNGPTHDCANVFVAMVNENTPGRNEGNGRPKYSNGRPRSFDCVTYLSNFNVIIVYHIPYSSFFPASCCTIILSLLASADFCSRRLLECPFLFSNIHKAIYTVVLCPIIMIDSRLVSLIFH
ncbi:hypothetical protein TNCV_2189681 [Trichonephila clavipes]|nr:hypothetical protein TNCV_2189681 [Trichonephila clavipes]